MLVEPAVQEAYKLSNFTAEFLTHEETKKGQN